MKELSAFNLVAFILPPATAMAGTRLNRWILGEKYEAEFGFGFRFAFGLAIGMLVFTQAFLFSAMVGLNAAALLAWLAILWGGAETVLAAMKFPATWKSLKFQPSHLWLLLLLPLLYSGWVFGQLSTLEGTLEYDANAFWVFKAKILYLEHGRDLFNILHQTNLSYTHLSYPMLVPCLYALDYGAVGGVDEFVNKVWPFWMMVALCVAVLSYARIWKNPHPLPIAAVTLIAFLPASLQFIRNEGGTIPMVFCISMTSLLVMRAFSSEREAVPAALPALPLAFAICFATKLEGVVFAGLTCLALIPFGVLRGWFKNKVLWKSVIVAGVCTLPYIIYRLTKPVPHPEDAWLHAGMAAAPHSLVHRFAQMWFLDVFARFFSPEFFHWQAVNDHLQWIGHRNGLGSLVNAQLSILPWFVLVALVITVIFKPKSRVPLAVISAVIIGVFTILSFVIACLKQDDLTDAIDFACNIVGRYYYPFLTAWFLAIATFWFTNNSGNPERQESLPSDKVSPKLTPQKPKRRG